MVWLLLAALWPQAPASAPQPPPLALVGATVIDGTGAPPLPDAVVLVRDGRIAAVGRRDAVAIPPGARTVDARGKWLLPGLIDMHVHLDEVISPEAFVLFGVTSVRDVGSRLVTIQQWRARAARGTVVPRIYWMGRNIDEGAPSWWGAVAVNGPAGVPALLADMARQGVDGVKLYVRAGPVVARAVIREAHRRGWPVTGHLDATMPSEAARMGIDNLEHVSTLFLELKPKATKSGAGFGKSFAGVPQVDLNAAPARRLLATLAKQQVAVTPTLVSSLMPVEGEQAAARVYAGWTDLPAGWRAWWKAPYWSFLRPVGWSARDYRTARQANAQYRRMVARLCRAGVPLLAGTDTPAPWVLPGAGLVHELELLVQSGLTPMSALRAATGRAADVLRRSADVGTVRPGRYADFLLLDADPLADIRSLRKVHAVYLAGREVDRAALQEAFRRAKK